MSIQTSQTAQIKKLSDRDHILNLPGMYIGATNLTKTTDYIIDNDKVTYKEIEYIPGLIKIINEIIDNSIDEAIKTDFKFSNQISVNIDSNKVQVKDNGRGIPIKKQDGHYLPELCWNHSRAGSNFDDKKNHKQIGAHGVGSFATAVWSKKFIGITDDGENKYRIDILNNAESFKEKILKHSSQGTVVEFYPDLERFGLKEIDEIHKAVIKQRLLNLSVSFPEITFKFNNKKISGKSFKKFIEYFTDPHNAIIYDTENLKFAFLPNEYDDFKFFTYVNGLKMPNGGIHIEHITINVVNILRDKLKRKYPTIKPGDIRNKLMLVVYIRNFNNPKFNSQTKESLTNSAKEFTDFSGQINYVQIANKILRTPAIIDSITEVYKIKEEFKKRQELKKLNKVKKIKSDKYTKAVGSNDLLLICEGLSAKNALLPGLGRKGIAYYELKGKPLNVYQISHQKFSSNKELTELYSIIQNEGFKKIGIASDADLDGDAIAGLVSVFIWKYLPDFTDKLYRLNTPVGISKKGTNIINWVYNIEDMHKLKGEIKYMKGLGSWTPNQMKKVISKDGLSKMLMPIEFTEQSKEAIDDWYNSKKTHIRKEKIMYNKNFSIIKV